MTTTSNVALFFACIIAAGCEATRPLPPREEPYAAYRALDVEESRIAKQSFADTASESDYRGVYWSPAYGEWLYRPECLGTEGLRFDAIRGRWEEIGGY